jgi:hypothetical protein
LLKPFGRQQKDPTDDKKTITVEYKAGDVITPTQDELEAFPDFFENPPEGYVLAPAAEETPAEESTTTTRSRR